MRWSRSVSSLLVRRLALASLVANVAILLTGGAVRLTGSGLGCPTWPRCTEDSWASTAEMGLHGVLEFGNRVLGFVVGVVTLATLLAVLALRPRRWPLVRLAGLVLAGVGVQGLVGGATVWTDLNPWVVAGHFLLSIALIAVAHTLWRRVDEPDGPVRPTVARPLRTLAWLVAAATAALVAAGTAVTGSGPHAGDEHVPRNQLDPQAVTQVHGDLAFLLLGLAVGAALALRAAGAGRQPVRAAGLLVAVIIAQGAVGLVQYVTGLPELLVWLHLLGSCLVWLAALHLLHATRVRVPPPAPDPGRTAATTRVAAAGHARDGGPIASR